jgi:hypothetical protein
MPCYRCGERQVDPEPGKPSPWHRGVVREHQVLICPECYPAALTDVGVAELARCSRCDSVRLVRRLDQVECLNCQLARDVLPDAVLPDEGAADALAEGAAGPAVPAPRGQDSGLAAEVASALARILGTTS